MIENEDAVRWVGSQHTRWHERKHQRTRLPNEIRASQAHRFWDPPLVEIRDNQLNKSKIYRGCGFTNTKLHAFPRFPLIRFGYSGVVGILATFGEGARETRSWFFGCLCLSISHLYCGVRGSTETKVEVRVSAKEAGDGLLKRKSSRQKGKLSRSGDHGTVPAAAAVAAG